MICEFLLPLPPQFVKVEYAAAVACRITLNFIRFAYNFPDRYFM